MTDEMVKTRKPLRMRDQVIPEGKYTEHHVVVRTVAAISNSAKGQFSVNEVDQYLGEYFKNGWELFNTHFLNHSQDGELMCWILIR